ncbi:unnamed protein product [Dicrocoelium dendriticum]|nr:unnamed protein product [Dicrocoelium dendriticum]
MFADCTCRARCDRAPTIRCSADHSGSDDMLTFHRAGLHLSGISPDTGWRSIGHLPTGTVAFPLTSSFSPHHTYVHTSEMILR